MISFTTGKLKKKTGLDQYIWSFLSLLTAQLNGQKFEEKLGKLDSLFGVLIPWARYVYKTFKLL